MPHHLRWRSEIRSGERFGPGLYLTGDYLDGYPAWMEPMVALDGTEPARAAVKRQVEAGHDFIKVFTRLTPEQLSAITEEASALSTLANSSRSSNRTHPRPTAPSSRSPPRYRT